MFRKPPFCVCDVVQFGVVYDAETRVRVRLFGPFDAGLFHFEAAAYGGVDCLFHVDRPLRRDAAFRSVEVSLSAVKAKGPLDLVRHAYSFDTAEYDLGIDCSEYVTEDGEVVKTPSMTRQADAEDCDINYMMAKYQATGVEPRSNPRQPQWGDFSTVLGFQEALNIVRQSEADFALLPAEVRARFANDPAGMLRFLEDPGNRAEAERLGMVKPAAADPEPMRVQVVNEGRGETSPPEAAEPPSRPFTAPPKRSGTPST